MDQNNVMNMPRQKKRGNAFAITSLILGILSVLLFCTCINLALAALALIFGIIYLASYVPEKKWYAYIGIITAVLSVMLFILAMVIIFNSPAIVNLRNSDPTDLLGEYIRFLQNAGLGDMINMN